MTPKKKSLRRKKEKEKKGTGTTRGRQIIWGGHPEPFFFAPRYTHTRELPVGSAFPWSKREQAHQNTRDVTMEGLPIVL